MRIPGYTSTGSKRPEELFGVSEGVPTRMVRSEGCRLWDEDGREYLDVVMALGAVALGYAHPAVIEAAERAAKSGGVGSLAPVHENDLAERLCSVMPWVEGARFFKSGAEAVAAAVRVARVHTGRERVVTCGYHGWLDWCRQDGGVPRAVSDLRTEIRFNDVADVERALDSSAGVAALVIEPVIDGPPDREWLVVCRRLCTERRTVLVFDEIKTAFRVAVGGIAEQSGVQPDLMVVGKALGNGFPIAAVLGPRDLMSALERTWVSSTLATEFVSMAAAQAVLQVFESDQVVGHMAEIGQEFFSGLNRLAGEHETLVDGVIGIPQMCSLSFRGATVSGLVARMVAERGVLFKRSPYNFVSFAHDASVIDTVLARLDEVLEEAEGEC